jgi:hypothetical protein
MGKWTGELNGKTVSVTFDFVDHRTEGRFAVAAGSASPQELRIVNAKFSNNMNAVTFQVPNQGGAAKLVASGDKELTFEMQITGTDQAELRAVGQGASGAVIKLVRRK